MCSTVASDFRQHWMEIIETFVKLFRQLEEMEAKARDAIMQGHKEDNKENTLLKLQIASLKEMLDFKDTQIQLLQASIEAKDKEIKDLNEAKSTLQTIARKASPENEDLERIECLARLGSIQTEIKELSSQYQMIETEKKRQELSMMQLRVLTRENVLSGPKDKSFQVEEVDHA